MDSAKLNDWMQVIGIFALVASLIFVGLQMRQEQEIAMSEIYQGRAATSIERVVAAASSDRFTGAMAKLLAGNVDGLSEEERISLDYFFGAEMLMYENHHYQYEAGYLPHEHWTRNVSEMKCYFSHPFYAESIKGWEFRPDFQAIVDDAIASATSNPSDCWQ